MWIEKETMLLLLERRRECDGRHTFPADFCDDAVEITVLEDDAGVAAPWPTWG